jgi:uncharacterized protein YjcR
VAKSRNEANGIKRGDGVVDENKSHAQICGAKTRNGQPCQNKAILPNGRCRMHGGTNPGADPEKLQGNKNALKTGEHESIFLDTLEADEQALFGKVDTDKLKLLEEEIRLVTIRERRMLQRIQNLTQARLTEVELTEETSEDGMTVKSKKQGTLGQIQAIEDALTRVQAHKAKLIELKIKLEGDETGENDDPLSALTEVLRQSRKAAEQ